MTREYGGSSAIEMAIADVAARQRGHITRQQLLDLGLGSDAIDYRLATRRLDRVHRCRLTPADTRRQLGIPATSPARTLLDCAPRVRNLQRFVNDAVLSSWLTEGQLAEAVRRHPRAGGVRELLFDSPGLTHSALEDKFVAFCRRFKIKLPELQVPMDGRVVDAFFREEGVIIELDSWRFHRNRATFERDREKDALAAANGLITLRITDERLERAAELEARRLQNILEARRR